MSEVTVHSPHTHVNGTDTAPHVLVVDDEQHMCDICSRTLRRNGYRVTATSDPSVAVQLLGSMEHFDLLLTDIKMPGMSGLDLAHAAREQDPTIAIIIMTGFASFENIHQSVRQGIADFLSKPFELEQLRLAVEQALHKRTLLQNNFRLRAFEKLLDSSEQLTSTLELAEVATMLLHITLQQSGCRAGFVLKAEEQQVTEIVAAAPAAAQLLPAAYDIVQHAVEQRQYVVHGDVPLCQLGGQAFCAALVIGLRAQGDVHGVLVLCDVVEQIPSSGQLEEIVLLANHAGAAFRNALLYQQLGDAYQRLQELDQLKSEFISIASHELRTPLSIVLGYALMLRDKSDGEHREYAQRVMEGGQRIKDIVDDMVSLRHLETGEAQLRLDHCSVSELVRSAIAQAQHDADERQQVLNAVVPETPVVFACDREKLLLILAHLISNAIKFTPKGGSITVRASLQTNVPPASAVVVTQTTPPAQRLDVAQWVVLDVEDTGIGVPKHEQARIFERFYQVADSLTRVHGGTGLGLAIVRELVSALGGLVWVVSDEQQGSTFTFALPYQPAEPSA
jgi:signal transduction histidine kinase/CheY-like chemotaxis protein